MGVGVYHVASTEMIVVKETPDPLVNVSPTALPNLHVTAWGLFDPQTGAVIVGKNEDIPAPIASITKLFTASLAYSSPHKEIKFSITPKDVSTEGRAGKLVSGVEVSMYTLLFPLLLESSNDAAMAIQRMMERGVYQNTMTELLSRVNLHNTKIQEPSGLDPNNMSTVNDLALFLAYLKKEEPHILDITTVKTYVTDDTEYINTNPGLKHPHFRGGKHGYLPESDTTFVGIYELTSGKEFGMVILGSTNIEHDIETLISYAQSMR